MRIWDLGFGNIAESEKWLYMLLASRVSLNRVSRNGHSSCHREDREAGRGDLTFLAFHGEIAASASGLLAMTASWSAVSLDRV